MYQIVGWIGIYIGIWDHLDCSSALRVTSSIFVRMNTGASSTPRMVSMLTSNHTNNEVSKTIGCFSKRAINPTKRIMRSMVVSYMFLTTVVPLLLLSGVPFWGDSARLFATAQTTLAQLNITAWNDCSETLPNTDVTSQFPLLCSNAQTFTRLQLKGTVELSGGFFNDTILNGEWQCVPSTRNVSVDTLAPNGECTALPDNTRVQVTVGRPRYGWQLEFVSTVPYGYILVNYTVDNCSPNATFSQPQLLNDNSTWLVNETCSGLADMQLVMGQGCVSAVPGYITSSYMANCGACGENPYLPLMRRAIVEESLNINSMNGASCGAAAMCYSCNSTNSTLLTQRTVYQAFAFGGPCSVYRVQPTPQLYIDAFVNVSILNGSVSNGVLVSGVYDQGQAQVALSLRSPTLRASLRVTVDPSKIDVRQENGYIIICDDPTASNSTRPPGVLGPFNWLYNTSGYVPSFRWNQLVQPPALRLGQGRQKLRGSWIYLTAAEYEARFQKSIEDTAQCGLTQIIAPESPLGTDVFYTNVSAIPLACAALPYNASAVSNVNFFEQVHPGEGACVPGMDPRFNVDPGKKYATNQTVCQMMNQMDKFAELWDLTAPTNRASLGAAPFLPDQYDLNHPQYYLSQLTDLQYQQQNSQLVLMYTPPNLGRGVLATYDLIVDVSTDLVPYVTEDTVYVVLNSGGAAGSKTMCRYWMPDSTGYYGFEICQFGSVEQIVVDATVSNCDVNITFLREFELSHQAGLQWIVSEDQRSATYKNLALLKSNTGADETPYSCAHSSTLLFNLTEGGLRKLGNTNGALLDSCLLTLNMTVLMVDGNYTTMTQKFTQGCAANNARASAPWSNVIPQDQLLSWQVWLGLLIGGLIVLGVLALVTVGIVYAIKGGITSKKRRYSSVSSGEMNAGDMHVMQQISSL